LATKLANTEKFDKYASGFAAYDGWVKQLADDAAWDKMPLEKRKELIHPNAWVYFSLLDARKAAARYLHAVAGDLGPTGKAQVEQAADLYEQIATLLGQGQRHAPFPQQLKDKEWTSEMRHAELLRSRSFQAHLPLCATMWNSNEFRALSCSDERSVCRSLSLSW
jgi:hypothetical protein